MKTKAVIDTNVVISGLISTKGIPAQIIKAWRLGLFQSVTSPEIISECKSVLFRPKFSRYLGNKHGLALEILDKLFEIALVMTPAEHVKVCKDPQDDMFFSVAKSARADYIVSGDRLVEEVGYFERTRVVTPTFFYLNCLA